MKIIIDTNILMSALIKDSITRKIIFESGFDFYYPMESFKELLKYKSLILEKSGMDEIEYNNIFFLLLRKIKTIHAELIQDFFQKAKYLMHHIDPDDIIFIATALAFDATIWSDDMHFQEQNSIRIFTTKEMIKLQK